VILWIEEHVLMTSPEPATRPAAVVIGLGLMGCDIAAIFLSGGWRVAAVEPGASRWPAQRERVRRSVAQIGGEAHAGGEADADARLTVVTHIGEVDWSGVALVIECAPENLDLKRRLFAELDTEVPEGIPVGTNSSSLRITDIARTCRTRARMANLHFFLPAHLVPAVEVVRGEFTDAAVCERLTEIMQGLGRVPIRVARDVPGFLANRMQHALMREAYAVINEGLATPEDVDAAVRFGFGFRYVAAGPILQKDLAGLDTNFAAAREIYPTLNNSSEPLPVLRRLVEAGKTGVKSGEGFWKWPPDAAARTRERYERVLKAAAQLLREDAGRGGGGRAAS
jgi:3-hydroxybutyryl-CoA dehydrogenase